MPAIAQQRCFIHAGREAVARCPECRNAFCRECVTEHQGRVVCAACLRRIGAASSQRRRGMRRIIAGSVFPACGLALAWACFYAIGRLLALIPASVHDGTIWSK